jgi:hypothetical protein
MKENLRQIAISLITQYGDEAETIAMLRAAEYAAMMNSTEWAKWEEISIIIETINQQPHDG